MTTSTLEVALGEYDTGWHSPDASLSRAAALISDAKGSGADLVVLPEMCTTGFTMEAQHHAEPLAGPSVERLRSLARQNAVHLVAGVATRDSRAGGEKFFNSSVYITPGGNIAAEYRKQRLFAYATEHSTYSAGEQPAIVTIGPATAALFICFDLRFPELFRAVAPKVDLIVVIANWPSTRHAHWQTLLRARAIESQAFVVGVNRTGSGGGLDYSGGSVIHDPWGETIVAAKSDSPATGQIDTAAVTAARRAFPFVPDERPVSSTNRREQP